jgi:hypothetical protein
MITNKVRQESIKPTGSNIVVSARWHTLTLPLTINNLQNSRFELKHPLLGLLGLTGREGKGKVRQGKDGKE